MSLGARLSGLCVETAIELDKWSVLTYAHNHPDTSVLDLDVRHLSAKSIKDLRCSDRRLVLFGGPPCQGFSYSNPRHRNKENCSNWLFEEFFRYVEILTPHWIVFENVRGIADTAEGYFLDKVRKGFRKLGFRVTSGVLNSGDFGVPQNRRRQFIVANRVGSKYRFPKGAKIARPISVGEAIGDLPPLKNGHSKCAMPYGEREPSQFGRLMRELALECKNNLVTRNCELVVERYAHIPQGGNWQNIPSKLMRNYTDSSRCHTGIYHRLDSEKPSVVIGNFRKNMLVHPTQDRGLSVREAARIQSFPDNYIFYGSIGFQQQQVGNAVPPLLAKAVFDNIIDARS